MRNEEGRMRNEEERVRNEEGRVRNEEFATTIMTTLYTGLTCPHADYIHTPLIEIRPVEDAAPLRRALARLASYDNLLVTSRHAVPPLVRYTALLAQFTGTAAAARPAVRSAEAAAVSSLCVGCAAALPQPLRLVAIGPVTAAALRAAGFTAIEQPAADNSYGVIDWFARQTTDRRESGSTPPVGTPPACPPRGRVLIPRSNLALSIIPDDLRRLGFIVDCVTAYNTCMPANPRRIDLTTVDRIVFTSPSTVDNFLRLYGSLPADKELVARGPITAQHLRGYIARPPISPISPISQLPHEPHEPQLSH